MLSYKFRLYPNKEQEEMLNNTLELCRQTYNALLEELNKQKKIDRKKIQHKIVELKKSKPELKEVYSKTLQYECYRLFSNLRALSSLKKKGKKIGRLRFKGKGWFRTFTYNQSGFKIELTGKRCQTLHLSKIGNIRIRMHRNIKGNIKGIIIKKYPSGKWYAYLQVENKSKQIEQKPIKSAIGIDLGIEYFTMDNNGVYTKYPLFLKNSLKKLAKEQKRLARKKKGSKNWEKQRIKLSRIYEKIVNQRDNFLHQLSRKYVNAYDCICVEDLDIKSLVRISYNARNILDSSWNRFIQYMSYKALSAGKTLVKVEARGTTQKCSNCGRIIPKKLWNRKHKCSCGLELDRDHNSAINILKLGLQKIGQELSDFKPVEKRPLLLSEQVSSKKQEAYFQNLVEVVHEVSLDENSKCLA